jgi:hypothetical protein
MRCWRQKNSTALSLLFVVTTASATFAGSSFDPDAEAQRLNDAVSSKYGSSEAITQNAVNPLTTSGSQMTNISGTTTFNAPLVSCPSSDQFMNLTIIPGSTGDISSIYVQQDTNFDNSMDYTYSVPVLVSGVCANGVISCTASTWENCSYYKWVADSAGKISLEAVTMQDLGGCFCVNNSCGNSLVMNQLSYVLTILGGGIAAAIQTVNPKWVVSNSSTEDMTISYYGQNGDQCSVSSTNLSSGVSNPEQYYTQDTGVLEAAGSAEASTQSADSGSVYNVLQSLSTSASSGGSYYTCTIQNTASVVTTDSSAIYDWLPWLDINVYCLWGRDSVNSCINTVQIDLTDDGQYDLTDTLTLDCCFMTLQDVTTHQPIADDIVSSYQQQYNVGSTSIRTQTGSESYSKVDGGGKGMHNDETYYLRIVEKKTPASCQSDYTYSEVDDKCYKDTLTTGQINDCASLETDANCSLKDETADGVTTYQNYQPTNLSPLASCQTLSGKFDTFNACYDWWNKSRTYYCQSSSSYDFSIIQERAANISSTTSSSSSSFSYQDKTQDASGIWSYSTNSVSADTTGSSENCIKACKTQKSTTNTQASLSGTTAQSNVSTESYEYFYHQCGSSGCPAGAGEEILADCQCINDFAESAAITEAMNEAGEDMICSSGTTTTL